MQRIAIVGAGPSGCALACFLRERNIECLIFDDNKKPSLLVGESLVPAAMPLIRRLGIENDISAFSVVKRGAALRHGDSDLRVDFAFKNQGNDVPDYAYNIPRPQFDNVLRQHALELGVKFIDHKAKVEVPAQDSKQDLQLSDESLSAAGLTRQTQPDLLIDATGRSRLFSRTLKLAAKRGPRNDVAHFAHFKSELTDSLLPGQIVITVLDCGWSWQIPLAHGTSVGVVMNNDAAQKFGNNAEQRLENAIAHNAVLNKMGYQRCSEVKTYSNYQLISEQAHGNGWVLLGDALGFVDPMLSPGVFMALESADLLDKHLFTNNLDNYYQEIQTWHHAWSSLIEYFYDGRMLTLSEQRPEADPSNRFSISKLPDMLVSGVLSKLVSGAGTRSKINQKILSTLCKLLANNPERWAQYSIKSQPSMPILFNESNVMQFQQMNR